ncbi:hypothetical protein Tco_0236911 [Tanacetum coccineum]
MSTQQDINAFRAQRLANTHDPLALMGNTQTPFNLDQSSLITNLQHPQPNNNCVQQSSFNTYYMPQPMQNLENNSDPTTAMNKALALIAKAFKINTIPTNNNQRSSLIPRNNQIAQSDMNMSQYIKMQMVDDNVGNWMRQNLVQNDGNKVGQNAVQNLGIQNVKNMNGLSVVSEISNQYGNGNVVTTPAEGNGNGINVKPRKWDVAYLQQQLQIAQKEEVGIQITQEKFEFMAAQASTSGTQSDNVLVYDSDGSTEVPKDENCYDHDIFNMLTHEVQYTDLQTELDRIKEKLENCIIKKEKEYAIEQLQARLGDLKGKSSDTQCESNTLDLVSQKLKDENVSLESQVSEQKGTTKGTRTNTMFTKQSILGKPPFSLSSGSKLNFVTPFPKSSVLPKVDKINALSKPVTSNSTPSSQESKVVKNDRVIAPGIFRINPFKPSRNDVNSKTNGFSPKDVKSTTRTRRPQPRNNPKSDKVPFKSKSSCLSNKLEKIEENHRSLQSSNYPDHTSSECNNIKLAIRNEKSEVICATCKQCLITANHDECVLQYVNGMKSRKKNQSANVSKSANQKKHKPRVWKPKKVGSKERLVYLSLVTRSA